GHVGDAGEERTRNAEDLLVDGIGHLVGDVAHGAGPGGHGQADQPLLGGHVEQLVFDPVAPSAAVQHAPDHQVVLVERTPGRVVDLPAAGRPLDEVALGQDPELAGTVEVGGHHGRDVGVRGGATALVGHGHHGN